MKKDLAAGFQTPLLWNLGDSTNALVVAQSKNSEAVYEALFGFCTFDFHCRASPLWRNLLGSSLHRTATP
jgi:hypothetical protein